MKRRGFYVDNNSITIGNYYENGTTDGEFSMTWSKEGVRLQIHDDAWGTFCNMIEFLCVIDKYGKLGKCPTMQEVVNDLDNLGYILLNSKDSLKGNKLLL